MLYRAYFDDLSIALMLEPIKEMPTLASAGPNVEMTLEKMPAPEQSAGDDEGGNASGAVAEENSIEHQLNAAKSWENMNARGGPNANDYKPNISRPPNQDGYNDPPVKPGFLDAAKDKVSKYVNFLDKKATEVGKPIATAIMECSPSGSIANVVSYLWGDGKTIGGHTMSGTDAFLNAGGVLLEPLQLVKYAKVGSILLTGAKVLHRHHILPQQFRGWFLKQGISNIDDYTVLISAESHLKGIHGKGIGYMNGQWNQRWSAFIGANPSASPSEIFNFAEGLLEEYGLNHLNYTPYK